MFLSTLSELEIATLDTYLTAVFHKCTLHSEIIERGLEEIDDMPSMDDLREEFEREAEMIAKGADILLAAIGWVREIYGIRREDEEDEQLTLNDSITRILDRLELR